MKLPQHMHKKVINSTIDFTESKALLKIRKSELVGWKKWHQRKLRWHRMNTAKKSKTKRKRTTNELNSGKIRFNSCKLKSKKFWTKIQFFLIFTLQYIKVMWLYELLTHSVKLNMIYMSKPTLLLSVSFVHFCLFHLVIIFFRCFQTNDNTEKKIY